MGQAGINGGIEFSFCYYEFGRLFLFWRMERREYNQKEKKNKAFVSGEPFFLSVFSSTRGPFSKDLWVCLVSLVLYVWGGRGF